MLFSVDIWRRLQIHERKWYVWRAVNGRPEFRRKEAALQATNTQPGPKVIGRPAPILTEDDKASIKSRPKTPPTSFGNTSVNILNEANLTVINLGFWSYGLVILETR